MPYFPVRKKIVRRASSPDAGQLTELPPLLRRVYAARQVGSAEELDRSLARLPSPWLLSGMEAMTACLIEAIEQGQSLIIIGDYDADGATASALALRGLRAMGLERIGYLVPNRFEYGYGLTPEIVALAAERRPDILLTVDNGIASLEGVRAARARGMRVLVTDHHLPGEALPEADAIVNPNLPGEDFPSRALAGVGVMFYVLMALRQRLRETGYFQRPGRAEPNLGQWLDLVALGTVADVVPLDRVNRILVHQGLRRIRSGQAQPGVLALLESAGRKPRQATAADLGFFAGPRLNAAGRLDDMTLGIECLLTDSRETASDLAALLDEFNRERRGIEEQMKRQALHSLGQFDEEALRRQPALCLFREDWHPGVVGLVASRLKDRLHRPVIALAPANPERPEGEEIRGSGRSIPGIHLRDVLADVATRHPGVLNKFGGHAMAAGLSLAREHLPAFARAFGVEVRRHAEHVDLEHAVHTDGPLHGDQLDLATAELLQDAGPWGQGFPEPVFDGHFVIAGTRIVGERHLKLRLKSPPSNATIDAIAFGVENPGEWLRCREIRAAYRLDVNEFRDHRSLQLRIEYMEAGE
jgi:single-stranded-DNA-specific exonuclease